MGSCDDRKAQLFNGACRERTNLRVQLQDTRATVGTLRIIMAVLLQAVNCFFWLAIYNVRPCRLACLTGVLCSAATCPCGSVAGHSKPYRYIEQLTAC